MRNWLLILILIVCQAHATVEDLGDELGDTGGIWAAQSVQTQPTYLPGTCQAALGSLWVTVELTGPRTERDRAYTVQGKAQDFTVSVKNEGSSEAEVEVSINPEDCNAEWFSWTTQTMHIPAGVSRSESLQVTPDLNAVAGEYHFKVEASAKCTQPGSDEASFKIQDYDYASETAVSGTGQFQLNKDVRSMNSGIKSNKNVLFSGSVDALVKNEYLVEQARGRTPNFQEQDAVDNYNALNSGDSLIGTESFKSSAVFGGVGAKVTESYDVQQMEFKSQNFNLHQTGSQKRMAEFKTADNFTGFYLIDAKQMKPGQKNLKEHEEYLGSFEINRRILFRDRTTSGAPCTGLDCFEEPKAQPPAKLVFPSPCSSGTCNDFVNSLNAFSKSSA